VGRLGQARPCWTKGGRDQTPKLLPWPSSFYNCEGSLGEEDCYAHPFHDNGGERRGGEGRGGGGEGRGGEGRVELGWPKFGGLDDEENMYDAMEFNNVESEGGEIGNATRIEHDYCEET
jgi:hypothetical protein